MIVEKLELNEGSKNTGYIKAKIAEVEVLKQGLQKDKNGKEYYQATFKLDVSLEGINYTKALFFTLPNDLWSSDSLLNKFRYATKLKDDLMGEETKKESIEALKNTDTYIGLEFLAEVGPQFDKNNNVKSYEKNGKILISYGITDIFSIDTDIIEANEKMLLERIKFAKTQIEKDKEEINIFSDKKEVENKDKSVIEDNKEGDGLNDLPF